MTSTLELQVAPLTALDRCDRCGAQARFTAKKDDMTLIFCGHHNDKNAVALVASGWIIVSDEAQSLDSSHSDG